MSEACTIGTDEVDDSVRKQDEMERDRRKSSGKRKKNMLGRIAVMLIALLVIVAGVWFGLWYKRQGQPYDDIEIVWNDTLSRNAALQYIPYSNGYMKVSRDGTEAVNSYGSLAWNVSYDMNHPVAASCREYAAVGDCGGKIVYMMDGTGALYWKNVPYPICEIETSAMGVTAVRMNDGMADYIQLITLAGEVLVEIKTLENKDGFPIDMALSEDGTKLVTSYLTLDNTEAGGWLSFYNFGEVGQNYSNNLAGVFKYDEVVPEVRFMDNDTVCAFRKESVAIYTMPELPELVSEIPCTQPILRAAVSQDYLAVVTDNTANGTVARVQVYDKKAQLQFDRNIAEEFDAVLLSGEDIVFYNSSACLVMNLSGALKFNSPLEGLTVKEIMPTGEKDKLIVFGETDVSTIRMIHTKEE